MDRAADVGLQGGVDEPVLLDSVEAREGIGDDRRLKVVGGPRRVPHLDLAARQGSLDALLDFLGGGHFAD